MKIIIQTMKIQVISQIKDLKNREKLLKQLFLKLTQIMSLK